MPKYYVTSADMKVVVVAKTPTDAAIKAVKCFIKNPKNTNSDFGLGVVIGVSETTFEIKNYQKTDVMIETKEILKASGLIDEFTFDANGASEFGFDEDDLDDDEELYDE